MRNQDLLAIPGTQQTRYTVKGWADVIAVTHFANAGVQSHAHFD